MSRWLLILAAICYGVAIMGGLAVRFHWLPFRPAFGGLILGLLGAAVIAMIAIGGLLLSSGRRTYLPPLLLSALPLSLLILALAPRLRAPLVNDVSTQGSTVPFRHAPALRADAENELEPAPPQSYPDLHPLRLDWAPRVVYAAATAEARSLGWTLTTTDPPHRFEAVSYTRWLRLQDDVVVVIEPTAEGSIVRMRSASRVGNSDFGENARRIRRFFSGLEARLAAVQS